MFALAIVGLMVIILFIVAFIGVGVYCCVNGSRSDKLVGLCIWFGVVIFMFTLTISAIGVMTIGNEVETQVEVQADETGN